MGIKSPVMKCGIAFITLLFMLISFNGAARAMPDTPFPYGLLEIRGYSMEMTRDGKFRIYSDSTTFVEGAFSLEGNKMTISDSGGQYACRGKRMNPGTYYWTVHDQGLYLMLIRDNCGARRTAFLEAPIKTGLGAR